MRTIRNSLGSLAIIGGLIGSLNFIQAAGVPMLGDGGDGGTNGTFTSNDTPPDYGTNLWLEITNIADGAVDLLLHNTQPEVPYELLSKQTLLDAQWLSEGMVTGVDNDIVTPATVSIGDRTDSLFIRALSWLDSDADGIPDWWMLKYFGHPTGEEADHSLAGDDYDSNGDDNAQEFSQGTDPNKIRFSLQFPNDHVNTIAASGTIIVSSGVPSYMAVLVNSTNFAGATWQSYSSNVVALLNSGDGGYDVWVGLRGLPQDAQQTWHDVHLTLDTILPTIVITNPVASVVSQPVIQLQGYSTKSLNSLTFDVSNAMGVISDQHGYLIGEFYDTNLLTFTTNWFQCLDVALADGLNTITLRATDEIGNTTTTNVSFTLAEAGNTNPPTLSVIWPQDGTYVGGSQFTFEGQVNDPTITVTAQIVDAEGNTNTVPGLVEQNGLVWVQNLPLAAGANTLSITATDAANRQTTSTLTVVQSSVTVTLDSLSGDQWNKPSVNVTGTVSDPSCIVTVNGVQATADEYGNWEAHNVPVSATGAAVFDVEVYSGSSHKAAVRPDLAFNVNDIPINTLIDSQKFILPQPPKVILSSVWSDTYWTRLIYHGEIWTKFKVNWILGKGGAWFVAEVYNAEYGLEFESGGENLPPDSLPGYSWQYASVVAPDYEDHEYYQNSTETKVMIVPQGQAVAGTTNIYLVRACASEFTELLNSGGIWNGPCGDLPLPPEWLQITNVTLVNSGVTNDDGSVWGVTVVSAPAGKNVDVTPVATQVYQWEDYTFDVQALDITHILAVDNNRDGQIRLDGSDDTTSSKPFRFWINDSKEHDDDESSGGADDQIPGQSSSSANYSWNHVQGRSDYVNFFPIALCLSNVFQWLPFTNGFEYHLSQADSAVKFAYTSLTQSNAFEYLTNSADANNYGSIANYDPSFSSDSSGAISCTTLPLADLVKVPGTGMTLNTNWLTQVQNNNGIGIILMEGCAATKQPLWLEIWRDGQKMGGVPLYLSISGVEQMFRHYNMCAYGNGTVDTGNPGNPSRYDAPNEPVTNGKNLVFLPGYNVNQQQSRGVESEMFKRFYWSGSKAKFYGVTWNGAESQITSVSFTPNYHTNVVNALQTAPHLADFLTNGLSGETTVAAHSLGNMVVLSAISDCGVTDIAHYFMIDAAVPIEAVQGNAVPDSYLIYPDWIPYANRLYASDWWQLFPSSDARSTLTWSNRLGNLASVDIYNFYSSGEEVLRENTNGAPPSEVGITAANIGYWLQDIYTDNHLPIGCYGWQWQEMLKGRGGSDTWVGSKHGGWAFNYYYYPSGHMLPGDASLLEDSQLQTNAFFDFSSDYNDGIETVGGTIPGTGSDQADMALYGSGGSAYAQANRNRILSDAIPALTLPVGANPVDRLGADRNVDMSATTFENGWPAARLANNLENNKWHHSDFDYVAYPFTHNLFDKIVNIGGLK